MQNTLEQRDKQFKHDRKKMEKEAEKLKERIINLTSGKSKELSSKYFSIFRFFFYLLFILYKFIEFLANKGYFFEF
jgi:hypothetical protein